MKPQYKVVITAGFCALFGMQVVMAVLLCGPDGIRLHAPMPGIAVPLTTTMVGDAWMKGCVSRIDVVVRDAAGSASIFSSFSASSGSAAPCRPSSRPMSSATTL